MAGWSRSAIAALTVAALALVAAGVATIRADGPVTEPMAGATTAGDGAATPDAADPSVAEGTAGSSLIVWAHGGIPTQMLPVVASLPDVDAAALMRADTLGLTSSRDASGAPVDAPGNGFRIPVEVAAVDPVEYAATMAPGVDRDLVASLAPRTVLLSQTSARLRRLDVGASLDLARLPGLRVAGIVADGAVGRAEIVLPMVDADAAGIELEGTIFLRHHAAPGPPTQALSDAVTALVPAGITARVVDVGSGFEGRRAPLVLSLAQVKERFGEPAYRPRDGVRDVDVNGAFISASIVSTTVPILGTVRCHRDIIDDLRGALNDIVAAGLAGTIDPSRYAGCFTARRIDTTGSSLSHHTWGIALDINVDLSLPGLGPPPDPEVIAAFERHGFRWGGDFLMPDNHHFEWVGDLAGAGAGAAEG